MPAYNSDVSTECYFKFVAMKGFDLTPSKGLTHKQNKTHYRDPDFF